jgi:hypothetical protein
MLDGTRASLRKGIEMRSLSAAAVLLAAAALPLRAEPPSFEDFFRGVSGCSLEMARYRDVVDATSEGVVIAPGRGGNGDAYGLLFNAPIEAVARSFPEFAGRQTVNGHLRQLLRLSDETGDDRARRKTLLMCTGGTAV